MVSARVHQALDAMEKYEIENLVELWGNRQPGELSPDVDLDTAGAHRVLLGWVDGAI